MDSQDRRVARGAAQRALVGVVRIGKRPAGSGFRIRAFTEGQHDAEPLATTFTHANGTFRIPLPGQSGRQRRPSGGSRVVLEATDRVGNIVGEAGPAPSKEPPIRL